MFSVDVAATPFFLKMEAESVPNPADGSALDFALMERIGGGDHEAFRALVERHQNAVIGTVAKMLGNASESEDIAQQVFLRIWRNAKRYRPDAKFTT
ncbi:MAG: sigma factor, partial [Luteolibacter sp.]